MEYRLSNIIKRKNSIFEKRLRSNWRNFDNISVNHIFNVAIVIINYNTLNLLSLLLFSLFKNLGVDNISKIVIVDNNSDDGSTDLLKDLEKEELIDVIYNKKQKYHGPALNQGVNYLNKNKKYISKPFRYIWILDSDVIILRRHVINDAIAQLREANAAVVGECSKGELKGCKPHVSSIFFDPSKVWNRNIHPFTNNGTPTIFFYRDIEKTGLKVLNFPLRSKNYLLHLGEGTLLQVFKRRISSNQHYNWASNYHKHHFGGNHAGEMLFNDIQQLLNSQLNTRNCNSLLEIIHSNNDLRPDFDKIIARYFPEDVNQN